MIIPFPGFPSFAAVAAGFGIETRQYRLRRENSFALDPDEIKRLTSAQTRLVLVNSPHNPTGTCVSADVMADLHDFCAERGIWFVSDEVYHPLYHGVEGASAASLPHAIVLGSCSKAFCASGTRVGWILDRNAARRDRFWTSRAYFTISNTPLGEAIAETVIRQRDRIVTRAREVAAANLAALDSFFSEHREFFAWVRPSGGTTSFPWLASGADSRPFCEAAARSGVVLAPGDCFGMPDHFRLGFAAADRPIGPALHRLADCVRERSVTKTVAV